MLENVKYNLGREYEFYATILQGQRSKGKTAVAIKKKIAHNRLNIRTTLQAVALEVYMSGEKKDNMLDISTPNRPSDRGRYERSSGTVSSIYDTAGRLQRTQPTVGK